MSCRYVGGFGRAGTVSAEAYTAAVPDPVSPFTPMIAGHMNADHKDTLVAMLAHYGDLQVDDAEIVVLDKMGMDLQVRVCFPAHFGLLQSSSNMAPQHVKRDERMNEKELGSSRNVLEIQLLARDGSAGEAGR